jgi:hypothetical protein
MDYDFIKSRLGPCGLHCGKCIAFVDGDIKNYSNKLKDSLGDFEIYANRFVDLIHEPVFNKYKDFNELLTYFASVDCAGCRKERCKIFKDCKVRDCHERKNVDFCFECSDFPCNNTGFDQHLEKRSIDINKRMQEIGVQEYYNEIKDKSRY